MADDIGGGPNMKFDDYDQNSPEQQQFFRLRFTPFARLMAELEATQGKIKEHLLTCKAEGIPSALLKDAYKDGQAEDPAKVAKRLQQRVMIASWFGVIAPGFQTDMFDAVQPEMEAAYERGKIAFSMGKDKINPFDKSVPQHAEYERGYDEQKAAGLEKFRKDITKNNAKKAAEAAAKKVNDEAGKTPPTPKAAASDTDKPKTKAELKADAEKPFAKQVAAADAHEAVNKTDEQTGFKGDTSAGDEHIKMVATDLEERRAAKAATGGGSA